MGQILARGLLELDFGPNPGQEPFATRFWQFRGFQLAIEICFWNHWERAVLTQILTRSLLEPDWVNLALLRRIKQTSRQTKKQASKQTNKRRNERTNKQTSKQTNKQTNQPTNKPTNNKQNNTNKETSKHRNTRGGAARKKEKQEEGRKSTYDEGPMGGWGEANMIYHPNEVISLSNRALTLNPKP